MNSNTALVKNVALIPKESYSTQQQLDFNKFRGAIAQRRYLALFIFLAILSGVTWKTMVMKNVYEAKSLVLIDKPEILGPLLRDLTQGADNAALSALVETLRKNMLSRTMVEKVIKKLLLDAGIKNAAQYETLVAGIQDGVKIKVQKTDLFEVSYQSEKPENTRDIVNTLVAAYIETNVGSNKTETNEAIDFIKDQIMIYKEKLDESDRQLRKFKENHPGALTLNENSLLERLRNMKTQLLESELQLKGSKRELESLREQLKNEEPLSIKTIKTRVPKELPIEALRLREAKAKMKDMLGVYTEKHPNIVSLKRTIQEMEEAVSRKISDRNDLMENSLENEEVEANPVYQALQERLSKAQTNIDLTTVRITELKSMIAKDEKRLSETPKEQEELSRLTRGRSVYQGMHDAMMGKLEQASVSKAVEDNDKGASFRVLDPAALPVLPVSPNKIKLMISAFLLAIFGAMALPLGIEFISPAFRDIETIENKLGANVIGIIPMMEIGRENRKKNIIWSICMGFSSLFVMFITMLLVREIAFRLNGAYLFF